MRNPGRQIDKTHLSLDQAEARGFIHRDYIAHCLRWTHVAKHLQKSGRYKTARILDIGCGKEMPLAKLLHSSRMAPTEGYYYGIDANKLELPEQFKNSKWKPLFDGSQKFPAGFTVVDNGEPPDGNGLNITVPGGVLRVPDVVTCFEVLEHVTPIGARNMLQGIFNVMADDGIAFISTPCWDPDVGAADNHINEMRYNVMGLLLEELGFQIEGVWGTFASISDYKDRLHELNLEEAFDKLREYYDVNLLATIFAPLFPENSRNCLWQLRKRASSVAPYRFAGVMPAEPWSSHPNWRELLHDKQPGTTNDEPGPSDHVDGNVAEG